MLYVPTANVMQHQVGVLYCTSGTPRVHPYFCTTAVMPEEQRVIVAGVPAALIVLVYSPRTEKSVLVFNSIRPGGISGYPRAWYRSVL